MQDFNIQGSVDTFVKLIMWLHLRQVWCDISTLIFHISFYLCFDYTTYKETHSLINLLQQIFCNKTKLTNCYWKLNMEVPLRLIKLFWVLSCTQEMEEVEFEVRCVNEVLIVLSVFMILSAKCCV